MLGGFIVRFDTELGAQPLLENFASDVNVTVTKFVQGRNVRIVTIMYCEKYKLSLLCAD